MALSNIQLTPQLVQAVRDAIDILDIASEYTRLKRAGRSHTGLCPLHKEKTPSFSVDAEQGLFYCFGCGQGGDAIRLHMLLSGDDFPAAIEALAGRYGIPLPTRSARRSSAREEPDVGAALQAAEELFRQQLERAAGPSQYLERRGFDAELVRRFRLGYAPASWDTLHTALAPKVTLDALVAAGLAGRAEARGGKPYDRFRNRLMFPIRSPAGRLVGFGGRALDDDPAKYVNTPETESFRKRHLLFGLDQAKRAARESGRLLLVEGYFDQLAAVAAGVEWAVATMGTSLTEEQARLASRFADEVVIGYDGDTAGEEAARRAIPLLLGAGLTVRRLRLPEGEDPDSFRQRQGAEALHAAVLEAGDAVATEIARLTPSSIHHDPRAHRQAARDVRALLAPLRDPTLRLTYGRQAAGRLGLPVEELLRQPRTRGARSPAAEPADAPARPASPVVSLEERLLELLFSLRETQPDAIPPFSELPPPEAFLDESCRNIFRLFGALYSREGRPPSGQEVVIALEGSAAAVENLARLLLKSPIGTPSGGPAGGAAGELAEAFRQITNRWRRRRLQELKLRIDEAQRQGDSTHFEQLLAEKASLSRALHRPEE